MLTLLKNVGWLNMRHLKITYLGIINEQFKYKIMIQDETFDYSTGLGWTKNKFEKGKTSRLSQDEKEVVVKCLRMRMSHHELICKPLFREIPSQDDILDCLFLDHDAGQLSFDDFCFDFGYDNDSLKALDVYRQCAETTQKVRKLTQLKLIKRPLEVSE